MTKQGAIKARMTSPDVCLTDVNNSPIMEAEGGKRGNDSVQSYQTKCQKRVSSVNILHVNVKLKIDKTMTM